MYILLMYYISLLLLSPDGFVLCYIGLLVLTLWRFDDDVIGPSSGMRRYNMYLMDPRTCLCAWIYLYLVFGLISDPNRCDRVLGVLMYSMFFSTFFLCYLRLLLYLMVV